MLIINKEQTSKVAQAADLVRETANAFISYSKKANITPAPLFAKLNTKGDELCVKTAYVPTLSTYTVKKVAMFHTNKMTLNGTMSIFDSETGELLATIDDKGFLTTMRTVAAVLVSEKAVANPKAERLGVLGAGAQSTAILSSILSTPKYKEVYIWNRNKKRAAALINKLQKKFPNKVYTNSSSISEVCTESETVITATSGNEPLIFGDMLRPGQTIIAIGADMPEKCELDFSVYKKASSIVLDSLSDNIILGGYARAYKKDSSIVKKTIEIGSILSDNPAYDPQNLTIVKLVGLGIQDTYVGNYVYSLFS